MNQANEKRVYKFICVLLYIAELPEREKEKETNWQNFLITNQRVTRGAAAFLVFFFFFFLFFLRRVWHLLLSSTSHHKTTSFLVAFHPEL